MRRTGKPQSARHGLQFAKKTVNIVGYVLASVIVAMVFTCWPASSGDILVRSNLVPVRLAAAAMLDRAHESDRLALSFEQRWSTVRAAQIDNKSEHEPRRIESRIEKIPFSCELAFSRIISKGNFSTRCIANSEVSAKLAALQ